MGSSAIAGGIARLVIFLDENHCRNPHLQRVLNEAGVQFESHLEHFSPGTEDTAWLPEVGRRGWCLLTTDKRIRKRPLEREAVRANFVRMFYFSTNRVSGAEMGAALKRALPKMRSLFESTPPPFTASISRSGNVELKVGL
jgi:hypothetical protein